MGVIQQRERERGALFLKGDDRILFTCCPSNISVDSAPHTHNKEDQQTVSTTKLHYCWNVFFLHIPASVNSFLGRQENEAA